MPLLGVCRGMQLLNVALGGTLVQHLDGHVVEVGAFGEHPVKPVPGTRYAGIVPEETAVPTYHHQAVDRLGEGLVPSAHAADGTVEAVELPADRGWVLGVQWHPEMGPGPPRDAGLGHRRLVSPAHSRFLSQARGGLALRALEGDAEWAGPAAPAAVSRAGSSR